MIWIQVWLGSTNPGILINAPGDSDNVSKGLQTHA